MFSKLVLVCLIIVYSFNSEVLANYIPIPVQNPSSNVNSNNDATARNGNSKTIVVGGSGGGGYPYPCDNGGLFGIASRYFVGGGCPYGK